jgi:PRTRC genetic system protein C
MPLAVNGMERSFTFKKGMEQVELGDPDPSGSPEAVMSYYSNIYPELTTASVHGPEIREDKAVYEFRTTIGTKG